MKLNPLSAISVSSPTCASMSSTPRSPPRRTSRIQGNGILCRRKSSVWWRRWWGSIHILFNSLNYDSLQILDGTRAGLALPEEQREELTTWKKELSQVCLEFSVCWCFQSSWDFIMISVTEKLQRGERKTKLRRSLNFSKLKPFSGRRCLHRGGTQRRSEGRHIWVY